VTIYRSKQLKHYLANMQRIP